MTVLAIILVALGVAVALGSKLFGGAPDGGVVQAGGDCATCSGDSDRCLHDCMMEAATAAAEYYDDEELDAFAGRSADGYTDDEAELFRDVMLTMQPREVVSWRHSLERRGVELPDQIRDELLMIVGEATA